MRSGERRERTGNRATTIPTDLRHRVEAHRDQIQEEVAVRADLVRGNITTRYNTLHHVECW